MSKILISTPKTNCQEELEEVVETSQKVVETEDGFEDALFSKCHE